MGRLPAQTGTEAILSATHTIGVAQCALRRSLRSSHLAELAGRSCPHRWARSGLLHPGGPLREIPAPLSLDCHFYSNKYTKNGGAKGIRTPDLLHAIQGRLVARRGRASPGVAAACDNYGWMWPGTDGRLATLAPNLAPQKTR
jgi:hypothetical protein